MIGAYFGAEGGVGFLFSFGLGAGLGGSGLGSSFGGSGFGSSFGGSGSSLGGSG